MHLPTPFFREAGTGPGVVCLHANASTSSQWRALIEILAPKFHVLAADSYGAGKSPAWPTDRAVRLQDEVALLDPVFARAGDPFTLVAHSYGAAAALIAAVSQPHRVRARVRGMRHARGTVENSCVIAVTDYLYLVGADASPVPQFNTAAARREARRQVFHRGNHMAKLKMRVPVTNATVIEVYEQTFAPWIKELGLCEFSVSHGHASARLPQNPALKFSSGAVCGQVIMSAIDVVMSLAMFTTDRVTKGTIYQHTHFLRPALDDDFHVQATVLRFGQATAFGEARVTFVSSGELVAHATAEFAF